MDFFIYCRDRSDSAPQRKALLKDHWAFMARYADRMIARGPTLSEDGKAMTGSMHIVDLPDVGAASAFAHEDPFAKGGVFEQIMLRRFENVLGRTMWQFTGDPASPRFLLLAETTASASSPARDTVAAQRKYLEQRANEIILGGPLFETNHEVWSGTAMMLEATDRAAAESCLRSDPLTPFYGRANLWRWRFGGAENLSDLM